MEMERTGGPRYQQIAAVLRRRIAAGDYPPGAQLPTEGQLTDEFAVSRITVRGALDRLTAEGLLRRERGRGTFVAARPIENDLAQLADFAEEMGTAGLETASRVLHHAEEPAAALIAAELGLTPGTAIIRLDRLRLAGGQPLAFDCTYLPLRYGRLLERDSLATETVFHQLETRYGIPLVAGRYAIEATAAAGGIAAALGLPVGTPLLLLHRTLSTSDGTVVYYQQRHYRGDRVRYTLDLRRAAPAPHARLVPLAPHDARDDA